MFKYFHSINICHIFNFIRDDIPKSLRFLFCDYLSFQNRTNEHSIIIIKNLPCDFDQIS